MGVPVTGYSLDIGKAHTDFAEAKLQRRLIEKRLDETEVDQLALVAMAGASAEAMKYDEVGKLTECLKYAEQMQYFILILYGCRSICCATFCKPLF